MQRAMTPARAKRLKLREQKKRHELVQKIKEFRQKCSEGKGKRKDFRALHDVQGISFKGETESIEGSVQGVRVGDSFRYRTELKLAGLHKQHIAGIDYISRKGFPLAMSIVATRQAGDIIDRCNNYILRYRGSGGGSCSHLETRAVNKRGKVRYRDQTLHRGGNLALVNSIENGNQVRVIYGDKSDDTKEMMYTYYGLYHVTGYDMKKKKKSHEREKDEDYQGKVYIFTLERCQDNKGDIVPEMVCEL